MSTPSNVVLIPRAKKGSFNPNRSLKSNPLLKYQLEHFREAEKSLDPERRTGIDAASITNQLDAGAYIAKVTAELHRGGRPLKERKAP